MAVLFEASNKSVRYERVIMAARKHDTKTPESKRTQERIRNAYHGLLITTTPRILLATDMGALHYLPNAPGNDHERGRIGANHN